MINRLEGHHAHPHGNQQRTDINKSEPRLVKTKEYEGPQQIYNQLHSIYCQGLSLPLKASFNPNQPRGQSHESIQHSPCQAKQPARRVP
eukprot:Gb_29496 [translate_table: standard]